MTSPKYQPSSNYYSLLGIPPTATAEEIKAAFYCAVRRVAGRGSGVGAQLEDAERDERVQ